MRRKLQDSKRQESSLNSSITMYRATNMFSSPIWLCQKTMRILCSSWMHWMSLSPGPFRNKWVFLSFFQFSPFLFYMQFFKKSFFAFLRLLFVNFVFKLFHFSLSFWNFVLVCWFVLVMNIYMSIYQTMLVLFLIIDIPCFRIFSKNRNTFKNFCLFILTQHTLLIIHLSWTI